MNMSKKRKALSSLEKRLPIDEGESVTYLGKVMGIERGRIVVKMKRRGPKPMPWHEYVGDNESFAQNKVQNPHQEFFYTLKRQNGGVKISIRHTSLFERSRQCDQYRSMRGLSTGK